MSDPWYCPACGELKSGDRRHGLCHSCNMKRWRRGGQEPPPLHCPHCETPTPRGGLCTWHRYEHLRALQQQKRIALGAVPRDGVATDYPPRPKPLLPPHLRARGGK